MLAFLLGLSICINIVAVLFGIFVYRWYHTLPSIFRGFPRQKVDDTIVDRKLYDDFMS